MFLLLSNVCLVSGKDITTILVKTLRRTCGLREGSSGELTDLWIIKKYDHSSRTIEGRMLQETLRSDVEQQPYLHSNYITRKVQGDKSIIYVRCADILNHYDP